MTAGLLLQMLTFYFGMRRYIVLDSGLCVLNAIIKLKCHELFGCALIKKRRYLLANIPGDAINDFFNMEGVDVRDFNTILGTMYGTSYNIWAMKEPDYVMKMMACGGNPLVFNCKSMQTYTPLPFVTQQPTNHFPLHHPAT